MHEWLRDHCRHGQCWYPPILRCLSLSDPAPLTSDHPGANVHFAANYTLPYWQKNFERTGQLRKAAYICCAFARALIPNFTTTGVVTFSLVNKRTDGAFSRVRIRTEGLAYSLQL